MRNLTVEERVVLDQLMAQGSKFRTKPVLKKHATNLKAKDNQFQNLNLALDLLLEGPTKKHLQEFNGQHQIFNSPSFLGAASSQVGSSTL